MKITLLSIGTRGDVQPFLALGLALRERGHAVRLAAPDNFAGWVRESGLDFHPLGVDLEAFMQSPEAREVLSGNWFALGRIWRKMVLPMIEHTLRNTWQAGRDADLLVYHPKAGGTPDVAEKTGATLVCAAPIPMIPTGAFPVLLWTGDYGRWLNRASYAMFSLSRLPYRGIYRRFRRSLGLRRGPELAPLGSLRGKLVPRLCAVSPAVLPRPSDWDADAHLTGYWFLDEDPDWEPDAALRAFLAAGPPPVYVGFGSMTSDDPEGLARTIVAAARRAGVRVLLGVGWGGLAAVADGDDIHTIRAAPHARLFPLVRAVVHHGGAGTTAAGLRAGRPTLICPAGVDQPFWGERVARLGCGPPPLRLRRLTEGKLAERLAALVGTPSFGTRAAEVAARIAAEDGVGRAVALLEAYAAKGRRATGTRAV